MNDNALLFDAFAGSYEQLVDRSVGFLGRKVDFFTAAKVHHLVDVAGRLGIDVARASVLDVGCGTGGADRLLDPRVGSISGVDVSAEMVSRAAAANPFGCYQRYDGSELPFGDGSFDVTFAICVMHHVAPSQWSAFVGEMARVTRPRGAVMVFEHNPLNPLTRRAVNNCEFDEDAVLLGPRRVRELFASVGLDVRCRRYILLSPVGAAGACRAERLVGWLPAGAQFVVAATRSWR